MARSLFTVLALSSIGAGIAFSPALQPRVALSRTHATPVAMVQRAPLMVPAAADAWNDYRRHLLDV